MSPRIIEEILPRDSATNGGENYVHTVEKNLATEYRNALVVIREDLSRQLGLMSDSHNTMLQSVGILVAFASILFLQLIAMGPALDGNGGILFMVSMGSFLLCGIYGVVTISESRGFVLSAGLSIEEEKDLYETQRTNSLEERITERILCSCETAYQSNTRLADRMTHVAMLLMVGILTLFIRWCI